MPELPEVETIVRALRDGGRGGGSLKGRTISSVASSLAENAGQATVTGIVHGKSPANNCRCITPWQIHLHPIGP